MLEEIKEAFDVYKEEIKQEINALVENGSKKLCEACAKNIEKIKSHANFDTDEPNILSVEADSAFEIEHEHLTRLAEHEGMPAVTYHDFCETCYTNFYYEFYGFDSDQIFQFERTELAEIYDYRQFLARQKNIYFQKFALFLTNYFKGKQGDVTLYVSLDETLKRKNHDYLVSYYTKEGKPLEKLDHIHTYLSETEMYAASRIGWLFEKEFLQQITYPLEKIVFEYSSYGDSVNLIIDIKQIKERLFFDVYSKNFVPFETVDLENIHMIKRNADTYTWFGEVRKEANVSQMEAFHEIGGLFNQFFEAFGNELLNAKFGSFYKEFLQKEQEEKEKFDSFFKGLKGFDLNRNQTPKPTALEGIEKFDNVRIENGLYQGMKACVKEIDFDKETIGLVFFGETNFDNVIHLKPDTCAKL